MQWLENETSKDEDLHLLSVQQAARAPLPPGRNANHQRAPDAAIIDVEISVCIDVEISVCNDEAADLVYARKSWDPKSQRWIDKSTATAPNKAPKI